MANSVANSPEQCPKCGSGMEQGFVLDNTYGARVVSQWAAGAPLKSFWAGTKLPDEKLVPRSSRPHFARPGRPPLPASAASHAALGPSSERSWSPFHLREIPQKNSRNQVELPPSQ